MKILSAILLFNYLVNSLLIRSYNTTETLWDVAIYNDHNGQIKYAHCYYDSDTKQTKVSYVDPSNSYAEKTMSFMINITDIQIDEVNSNIVIGIGGKYIFQINYLTLTYQTVETEGEALLSLKKINHNRTLKYVVGGNRKRIYFKNGQNWHYFEQEQKQYSSKITYLSTFSDNYVLYVTKKNVHAFNIISGQKFQMITQNVFFKQFLVTDVIDQLGTVYELRVMITFQSKIIIDTCSSLFVCKRKLFLTKNQGVQSADIQLVSNASGAQWALLVLGVDMFIEAYKLQVTSINGLTITLLLNFQSIDQQKIKKIKIQELNQTNLTVLIGNNQLLRIRFFALQKDFYTPPCYLGFYKISTTTCIQCSYGCKQCSIYNCLSCHQGFYFNGLSCESCNNQGCLSCSNNTSCNQCHVEFFLNITTMKCIPCNLYYPNCLTCTVNSTKIICQSCQSSSFLSDRFCLLCKKAMIGCLACENNYTCYECQLNFTFIQGNASCLCQLPNLYHPGLQQCILCVTHNCVYCNQPNICDQCQLTYQNINGLCYHCNITGCLSCSDNNICQSCDSNYTLINGICIYCPIQGCLICENDNNCSICNTAENRFLEYGFCPNCQIQNCKKCLTSEICEECMQGCVLQNNICSEQIYHSFLNKMFQCQAFFIHKAASNTIIVKLQFNRQYRLLKMPTASISLMLNNESTSFSIVQLSTKTITLELNYSKTYFDSSLEVILDESVQSMQNYKLSKTNFTHKFQKLFFLNEKKKQQISMLTSSTQILGKALTIAFPSLLLFGLLSLLINLVQTLQIISTFYFIGLQLPSNFKIFIGSMLNFQLNGLLPIQIPSPFSDIEINALVPAQLQSIEMNINFLDNHFSDIVLFLWLVLINLVIGKGLILLLPDGRIRNFLQEKYGRKNYDSLIVQFQSFCYMMIFSASVVVRHISAKNIYLVINNIICLLFVGICILVIVGHYVFVATMHKSTSYQLLDSSYNIFDVSKNSSIFVLTYKLVYYGFICLFINFLNFYCFISLTLVGGIYLFYLYLTRDIFQNRIIKFIEVMICFCFLIYIGYFIFFQISEIFKLFDEQQQWIVGYIGIGIIGLLILLQLVQVLVEFVGKIINLFSSQQSDPEQTIKNKEQQSSAKKQQSNMHRFNRKRGQIILQQFRNNFVNESNQQSIQPKKRQILNKNRVHFVKNHQKNQKETFNIGKLKLKSLTIPKVLQITQKNNKNEQFHNIHCLNLERDTLQIQSYSHQSKDQVLNHNQMAYSQ